MATNVSTLCRSACGQPLKARRASARAAGIPVAATAAEILAPVGRRKLGRDRVLLTIECVFSDGETVRLSVGRHPKDSDAMAIEAGRRMAILSRAGDSYLGAHRAATVARFAEHYAKSEAGQRDANAADRYPRPDFKPDECKAFAHANAATRAWLESNPAPPLV